MVMTSLVIPPAAVRHHERGRLRHDGAPPWRGLPDLVLLDRDGTLVEDVPYNRDPGLVRPMPDAADALRRLRAAGLRVAVVTNQSGVASSRITVDELVAVNARVEELLGPFDGWYVCPHGRDEGCTCRKPAPGMVEQACADHDVPPCRCVLIGDIGSDVESAEAAGARGLLVPTPATRRDEVDRAPRVADSLSDAVDLVLGGRW
jgi:histidinol-phosphate phosphatase family protein